MKLKQLEDKNITFFRKFFIGPNIVTFKNNYYR